MFTNDNCDLNIINVCLDNNLLIELSWCHDETQTFDIEYCLFVYHSVPYTTLSFSYIMTVKFYLWKTEPRYIIKCIWEDTNDPLQENWQTFSHSHMSLSRIQTNAGSRWEVSWYETDIWTTWPQRQIHSVLCISYIRNLRKYFNISIYDSFENRTLYFWKWRVHVVSKFYKWT
jgi:hypothetical protein